MALSTEQYEKIIRFLDADMDLASMDAFEKELESNPEMRRQLDFEQFVRNSFTVQDNAISTGLKVVPEKLSSNKPVGKIAIKKIIAFGVAASVLVVLAIFALTRSNPPNVQRIARISDSVKPAENKPVIAISKSKDSVAFDSLFNEYFEKDPIPENYPMFLADAFINYDAGNNLVLQQLDLTNASDSRSTNKIDYKENILQLGHYYKGIAFLQDNNVVKAVQNLKWVLNNHPDIMIIPKAQWYLALSYLKNKEIKNTIIQLNILANSPQQNEWNKKAKSLLNALKGEQ